MISDGKLIVDNEKGIMPGMPFATFLSNLFLANIDKYFYERQVQYYRFADDILIFADSENELKQIYCISQKGHQV